MYEETLFESKTENIFLKNNHTILNEAGILH